MVTAKLFKRPFLLGYLLFNSFYFITINAQDVRGLYVNDFKNIIGDIEKENTLLQFAQEQNFNYLLLYNLYAINRDLFDLTKIESATPLSDFIHRAKTIYGIEKVGVVGEKSASFIAINTFNKLFSHDNTRRIDVYNLEFEFWHRTLVEDYYCSTYLQDSEFECNISGAFDFYYQELIKLRQLALANHVKTETYIGFTTSSQAKKIGRIANRVLVHYYRKSDVYNNGNSIYNYHEKRLKHLSPRSGSIEIMPIFSSRGNHMGPWLLEYPKEQAYTTFLFGQKGYEEEHGKWKRHVNITGYQWYRYTDIYQYLSGNVAERSAENIPPNLDEIYADSHLAEQFAVEETSSVPNWESSTTVKSVIVFPNPSSGKLFFKLDNEGNANLSVSDIYGKVYLSNTLKDQDQGRLDISMLENGIYFLVATIANKQIVKKFIVEN